MTCGLAQCWEGGRIPTKDQSESSKAIKSQVMKSTNKLPHVLDKHGKKVYQ